MLIQLPSGSPDQPGPQKADQPNTTFEAGLRRDLASAPIVSYDSMLGGWSKRALELTLTLLAAPLWLPVLLIIAAWMKARHRAPALTARECIGYGGRSFKCYSLRLASQLVDQVANDVNAGETRPPAQHTKLASALERLPQLFNVVLGDMALVGPRPLSREQLEPMRSARRYYLSARPGVVGVSTIIGGGDDPSQYKIYAMSWAVLTDALIFWDAFRSLSDRDDLWKPSFTRATPGQSTSGVVVRRRSSSN
jgi:lipopolysaccharide/colanic/teichoic acid biosynthesis glycosyltransferase